LKEKERQMEEPNLKVKKKKMGHVHKVACKRGVGGKNKRGIHTG